MADVQANIGINIDASGALAQLKVLQRQISVFNAEIAKGGANAAASAASMQKRLVDGINATGQFSASMTTIRSTTESFTNALEKNKFSLGEYFRFAGASTKKFGHLFTNEFNTIEKVARERVKTIQTQYIKMGRDANGALKAIAVRPLTLDMNNLATATAMAAQKQQIFNQLMRQGSTNLLNWGKNTQWAGRQLMVGFTIPLTIFGATAISSFTKLEEQAIRFRRVYGELFTPPEEADKMLDQLKDLALEFTKYGVAVDKTLEMAADAAAMGSTGADLRAQVSEASRLAVLGAVEQEQALETTISLTNAFGVAAEDLASKIDFLNAVENQTVVSIEDLTIAIPKAGPVVKQLGGDVEDLAFLLTAMKEGGINASEGANALKSGLASLINPTGRAKEMLAGFGINIDSIVRANKGDVSGIVVDFAKALDQLDPLNRAQAIEQLFGKFQFSRISTLFQNVIQEGTQAERVLQLSNATIQELAGLSESELSKLEASPLYQFQAAIAAFQAELAPIGESFAKLVTPIIEFGTKVLSIFNNLSDGAKSFIVGLVAAMGAVAPVLIMGIGLLANGFANFMKVLLGIQNIFQRLRGQTNVLGQQTDYLTQEQLEAAAVASSLNQSHSNLMQTFTSEKVAVDNLTASYRRMVETQRASLGLGGLGGAKAVRPKGFAKGRKVPGYKDGIVMVPGPRGAGDIQPAMLAPGEAVIPAAMAEKYAPLINSMIADNIPGYKSGRGVSPTVPVASHALELSPQNLSQTIQSIAAINTEFSNLKRVIWELVDNAQTGQRELHSYSMTIGQLSDKLASGEYNVFAAGRTFAGTTSVQRQSKNAMFEALMPGQGAGDPLTLDSLFDVANAAKAEQQKNTQKYQDHNAEMDELIALANSYQAAIDDGADVQELKNKYTRDLTEQMLVEAELAKENIPLEEAKQRAAQRLAEIDGKLADAKERELAYISAAIASADELVISPSYMGTEAGRQVATSRRASRQTYSKTPNLVPRTVGETPTGRSLPRGGPEIAVVAERAGYQAGEVIVSSALIGLEKGLQENLQSASPSKVTRREMGNAVDGAVQALREGTDDMRAAGASLADATEDGARSRRRGDPSRARTAGPITPGKPIRYEILDGKVIENTRRQLNSTSLSLGTLASSAINGANKLGMVGIGLSSLIGGLSMIEGPLGEFAGKLFPAISALTGLTFALNFLNAESVKNAIEERVSTAKTSVARQQVIKAKRMEQLATQQSTRITNINNAAQTRLAQSALAAGAALTATSMIAGGGAVGQAAGRGVGEIVGKLGSASIGISAVFSKLASTLATRFGAIGIALTAFGKSIGGALGALLGISGPVALVISGLALLGGGIFLLTKIVKEQQEKMNGLGDAAQLSSERLNVLNEVLGTTLSLPWATGVGGTGEAATGLQVSGAEEAKEAQTIQQQLLESDEFKKEYKGIIAAISQATDEAAIQALTSLAITLQTAGAEEEMVAGVVNAILIEAGRTEIKLSFADISIESAAENAQSAVDAYVEAIEGVDFRFDPTSTGPTPFSIGTEGTMGERSANAATALGGAENAKALDLAASSLSQAILNLNAQFDAGNISAEEYNAQIDRLSQSLIQIANSGPAGLQQAILLATKLAEELSKVPGLEGLREEIGGILATGTTTGVAGATAIMQARASGIGVSETDIQTIETGSRVGATREEIDAAVAATKAIEDLTIAKKEEDAQNRAIANSNAFVDQLDAQTQAISEQETTYNAVYDLIKDNADITNKAAFAQKIAADETLRAEFATAQAAGTTAEFIDKLIQQERAQAAVNAQTAEADLLAYIEQQKANQNVTEGLTVALGNSADAQALMNNAQFSSWLMSKLAAQGFDLATASAQDLAEALASEDIQAMISLFRSIGGAMGTAPRGGGGGGTPSSFLDDITKDVNHFANATVKVEQGFNKSLASLQRFSTSGGQLIGGLSSQLRGIGVSEPLIQKILGMDPKDWEKQKRTLFQFDAFGNITRLTAAGKAVQDALNVAELGKFRDEQSKTVKTYNDQLVAIQKLTNAGVSQAAAYEAVKDAAFASAVAQETNNSKIRQAAKDANAAAKALKDFAAAQSVVGANEDFAQRSRIASWLTANQAKLTNEQIEAILEDTNLQRLILDPKIDPKAVNEALANAAKSGQIELDIKKLTISGMEDIFNNGFRKAMERFDAMEEEIELNFSLRTADDDEIIKLAEREISAIRFTLDDLEADLDRIAEIEDGINKDYDERIDALDKVASINERIAKQQKTQLSIADALSQGDIAAAARAMAEARQEQAQDAIEQRREAIESARESALEAVRGKTNKSRLQIEKEIRDLQREIFNIEEDRLEPAQRRVEIATQEKDDAITSLTVLDKTREEWARIQNTIDLARTNSESYKKAIQGAVDIVKDILHYWNELDGKKVTTYHQIVETRTSTPTSSGGSGSPAGSNTGGNASQISSLNAQLKGLKDQIDYWHRQIGFTPRSTEVAFERLRVDTDGKNPRDGGYYTLFDNLAQQIRNLGGKPAHSYTRKLALGGLAEYKRMGGILPYKALGGMLAMANGGMFKSINTDSIPAMLTAGEYVVRRSAVQKFGVDNLEKINNGTYSSGSMYNYNLSVNVNSDADPNKIARTVIAQIKQADAQRIRGNRF